MASEHEGWLDKVTTPPTYRTLALRRGVVYGRRAGAWRLPAAVAVLGLAVTTAGQFVIVRPAVERQLRTAATQALVGAGYPQMQVEVQGRDVTLDGALPSASDIPKAIALVQGVPGVRVIKEIFVSTPGAAAPPSGSASPSPSPRTSTSRAVAGGVPAPLAQLAAVGAVIDGGVVTLLGAVPNQAAKADLVQAVAATFGAGKVVDALVVEPGAGGYGLGGFAAVVCDLGPRVVAGAVSLHTGRMTVSGVVREDSVHPAVARDAVAAIGSDPASLSDTVLTDPGVSAASDPVAAAQLAALPPVPFADNDSRLTPVASRIVGAAAGILLRHPKLRIQVQGHTDGHGDPAANLRLSQARAAQVVRALQADRVPGLQLSAFGFGASTPVVSGTGPLADALNRRVVFAPVTG